MRLLSPKRNSTEESSAEGLASEQLAHFNIDPESKFGKSLLQVSTHLYNCQNDASTLLSAGFEEMRKLDHTEQIALFNAKKFLTFQIAKLLDGLQSPFRATYQSLGNSAGTLTAKGVYPIFDNVTAIFSATPVIARTATYIFACSEWIEDAFKGKEFMLEIYSRLLNPTSIALANHVVDLECGPLAGDYMAWNFNSGMAAIDATLSHLLGHQDIIISSRNVYGGAWQLIHDWYAKPGNLDVAVETFDGVDADSLAACIEATREKYADRLSAGRKIYLYLESPCNPHGDILDVPAMSKLAHAHDIRVVLDATVGTPFLIQPLQREDSDERPDFLIHSYTKDMVGTGSVLAGCVIARNNDMFLPKGYDDGTHTWDQTLFWNVYYIKGAFLAADAAYEVLQGMKTMELRVMQKCINTRIIAEVLEAHPGITVNSSCIESSPSFRNREEYHFLGLPAALMTIDIPGVEREAFQSFFDCLSPVFGHMISLGQSNTIVSCPALTTHSELDEKALAASGLTPTLIRVAIGDEDPTDLLRHFISAARLAIDPTREGFSEKFLPAGEIDAIVERIYTETHTAFIRTRRFSS